MNPAQTRLDLSLWKKARKLAGIEDVRLHDLRHSFASQSAMQSIPLLVAARLLGHAQVQMTLRYLRKASAYFAQAELDRRFKP